MSDVRVSFISQALTVKLDCAECKGSPGGSVQPTTGYITPNLRVEACWPRDHHAMAPLWVCAVVTDVQTCLAQLHAHRHAESQANLGRLSKVGRQVTLL